MKTLLKVRYLIFLLVSLVSVEIFAQPFIEQTSINLAGVSFSSVAWGDYDNDGNLDVLITGTTNGSSSGGISKIYRNNGNNSFTEQTSITLTGVYYGSQAWGDYDNDGDLDILLTGQNSTNQYISKIYRNNGDNSFSEQTAIVLPGVWRGSVAWGDYDNDGDLDILLTGNRGTYFISKIYRNNGDTSFSEQTGIILPGVDNGSAAWGDYDNDGDIDVLLTGRHGSSQNFSKIFRNNGDNSFTEQTSIALTGVTWSSAAWGDYDNDGDLDLLLTGTNNYSSTGAISKIYRNNGNNSFTEQTGIALTGVSDCSVSWGDYDNDGDLDILLTGNNSTDQFISKIYRNNGNNSFTDQTNIALTGVFLSSANWGDYDNDGDLDILLTGRDNSSESISIIYRNGISNPNIKPTAPSNLHAETNNGIVILKWDKSLDIETPQNGLSYNLYVYENGQSNYECPPHAFSQSDTKNGKRLIAKLGSIQWRTEGYTLRDLLPGKTYYWAVQAVDVGLQGGNFSDEQSFTMPSYRPITQANCVSFSNIQPTLATATWSNGGGLKRVVFIKATTVGAADPMDNTTYNVNDITAEGWKCVYNGTGNSVILTGLVTKTDYLINVCEYNGTAGSEMYLKSITYQNPAKLNTFIIFNEPSGVVLTGVSYSSTAWGDYDNDGDLDVLLTGTSNGSSSGAISKIYLNNGDKTFTEQTGLTIAGVYGGCVDWGDYDNDGDLDILLTGNNSSNQRISKIYRNDGSVSFTDQTTIALSGVSSSSVDWGDYDNDGDLDIILSGSTSSGRICKIYRNNGDNSFTEQSRIVLAGVDNSFVTWGDYDNDGDSDILLTGDTGSGYISKIYCNNGDNSFTDQTSISLPGIYRGSVAWGDYDSDGNLDILMAGTSSSGQNISKIYRNNGNNTFSEQTGIELVGLAYSSVNWGDYDNDGDLDIILAGLSSSGSLSKIYKNNGDNTFEDQLTGLTGVNQCSAALGDYDNDGDLDILLTGASESGNFAKIYQNESVTPNINPSLPTNLQSITSNGIVTFTWDKPTDNETSQNGLNYNLYVYENGQSNYKYPPHAFRQSDSRNGKRLIAKIGNIQWCASGYSIKELTPNKTYYWTIQAIDAGLQGGNFSAEKSFTMPLYRPLTLANSLTFSNTQTTHTATWSNGSGIKRAVFVKATTTGTADPIDNITYNVNDITPDGWKCVYNGTENSVEFSGLAPGVNYLLQVCEYNGEEGSEMYSKSASYQNPAVPNTFFIDQTSMSINGITAYSASWGDYDSNGKLDVLMYQNIDGVAIYLYNGSNDFTIQSGNGLSGYGSIASGDYDNDGDLDIIAGSTLYRNNGGINYTEQTGFTPNGITVNYLTWGDYDNDGDLDILLNGSSSSVYVTKIYRNNGDNSFTEQTSIVLPGFSSGSLAWSDYDNDGYLDVLLTGYTGSYIAKLYHNNGDNSFTEQTDIQLPEVSGGSIAWGDYDNDGNLDVLLTGQNSSGQNISKIYRNNGNNFTEQTGITLTGVIHSSVAWGDYDNDGDLDILLTGSDGSNTISKIYRNNSDNSFTEQISIALTGVSNGSVNWGDYENDGDLDILLTGYTGSSYISKIYRNEILNPNTQPSTPTGLESYWENSFLFFKWNKSSDNTTPTKAISYNLRIGTTLGGNEVKSGQALSDGKLLLASIQNPINDTCIRLKLPLNKYYWSVQAIDKGGMTSSFDPGEITPTDSIQAEKLQVYIKNSNSALIRWKNGNGIRRALFCRILSNNELAKPVNGKTYNAEPYFGQGDQIGATGWYCIYNGKADSTIIYGIVDGYSYDIQVVEYIENSGLPKYFKTTGDGNPGIFSTTKFTELTITSLAGLNRSSVAWGDYDNDGYLDILSSGAINFYGFFPFSRLYRNNGNNDFPEQYNLAFPVCRGSIVWGDYDNDEDLDILLTGETAPGSYITKILRNDSGVFSDINAGLVGIRLGSIAWGDYDNDGDLDILLTGSTNTDYTGAVTKIYQNNGDHTFTELTGTGLPNVWYSSVAWGDYDNDGDLDILLTGQNSSGQAISKIYNNNNGVFTDIKVDLVGVYRSSVAWGDYDNDGDLDILLTGGDVSKIYRNNGDNKFTEQTGVSLTGVLLSSAAWGDYDNDGDLDILLTGMSGSTYYISKIFRNNGNSTFTEQTGIDLMGVAYSSAAWGDYDNDGDLDILLTGVNSSSFSIAKIYKNNTIMKAGSYSANIKPLAPTNLSTFTKSNGINLCWSPVKTDETPYRTMSYNVRVSKEKNSAIICPPHTNLANGYRRIAAMGNAQLDTSFLIKKLSSGKYFWSVQAVDQGFKGGDWSPVDSFEVKSIQAFFMADTVCHGSPTHFTDQSQPSDSIASWKWDFRDGPTSSSKDPEHPFTESGSYSVKLVVTSKSGLKDSIENTILVNPRPFADFTTTIACQGSETEFINQTDINGLNILTWTWDFGDGKGSILKNPISHGYLSAGSYQVKLIAADNKCAGSSQKTVIVGEYPVAVVTANAPTKFCTGDSVILSVGSNLNYTYQWMESGTGITAANASSYKVKVNGSYSVEVNNTQGDCKTTSLPVLIEVKESPVKPIIAELNNNTLFCLGTEVELNVTNASTELNYQWMRSGVPISGAIGSTYRGKLTAGDYSVVVEPGSCSKESEMLILNTKPALPKPTIVGHGPNIWVLACDNMSAVDYRWYYNNSLIPGANKYQFVANKNYGDYYVAVNDGGECYTPSDVFRVDMVNSIDELIEDVIMIYPNPSGGLFNVTLGSTLPGELTIQVIDELGLIVEKYNITNAMGFTINLSNFPNGIYLCKLNYKDRMVVKKIVKQKNF